VLLGAIWPDTPMGIFSGHGGCVFFFPPRRYLVRDGDNLWKATQPSNENHDLSTQQQGTGSILLNFESLLFVDLCDRLDARISST
jgi:hypothetical protein